MGRVQVKRIYELAARSDGFRVLVDRLWPRGIAKKRAALDLWMKEIAPSTQLRRWFGHDPKRWRQFKARYRAERAPMAPSPTGDIHAGAVCTLAGSSGELDCTASDA